MGLGAPRGAWYADPYEQADERWWDGRGWTDQVRSGTDSTERPATHTVRIAGATAAAAVINPGALLRESHSAFLAVDAASGQMARLLPASSSPPALRRLASRSHREYELLATAGPVALFNIGTRHELARVECADGEWRMLKRRRVGYELLIESSDGTELGSYAGSQWLGGGTFSLAEGTEFELRRAMNRNWRLRGADPALLVDYRASGAPREQRLGVTIRALEEASAVSSVAVLAACAVLIAELTLGAWGGGR
jgi:hypothetical protein